MSDGMLAQTEKISDLAGLFPKAEALWPTARQPEKAEGAYLRAGFRFGPKRMEIWFDTESESRIAWVSSNLLVFSTKENYNLRLEQPEHLKLLRILDNEMHTTIKLDENVLAFRQITGRKDDEIVVELKVERLGMGEGPQPLENPMPLHSFVSFSPEGWRDFSATVRPHEEVGLVYLSHYLTLHIHHNDSPFPMTTLVAIPEAAHTFRGAGMSPIPTRFPRAALADFDPKNLVSVGIYFSPFAPVFLQTEAGWDDMQWGQGAVQGAIFLYKNH